MTKGSRYFFGPISRFLLLGCFVFGLAGSQAHAATAPAGAQYRKDRLLIVPRAGSETALQTFRQSHRHRLKKRFAELKGVQVIELAAGDDVLAKAAEYSASGLVESAEPDYIIHASATPNDPGFANCWGLNNTGQNGGKAHGDINAPTAWNTRNSAENVIVAVVDSGVRYTHEDLAANMWHNPKEIPGNGIDDDGDGIVDDVVGFNAIEHTGDPDDDCGHGTHVAGTIGAVANNGKGVAGVCWKVQIMALKFMDSTGYGDTSDAISCIDYARKHGAKVINASWGSSSSSFALKSALTAAQKAGMIFVAAAGNDASNNDKTPTYPANYNLSNVISVAATDNADELDSRYSNYGATTVDLAAPGTEIYSTWNTSDKAYTTLSGTSMATPHVTGAVALLCAAYPAESYSSIISRLLAGVDKLPSLAGKCVTGGRLDIGNLFPAPTNSIVSVQRSADGNLQLNLSGSSSGLQLQSSADLKSWQPVSSGAITALGQQIQIAPANDRCRFYRVAP
jgi:subtilisin family serine protease